MSTALFVLVFLGVCYYASIAAIYAKRAIFATKRDIFK